MVALALLWTVKNKDQAEKLQIIQSFSLKYLTSIRQFQRREERGISNFWDLLRAILTQNFKILHKIYKKSYEVYSSKYLKNALETIVSRAQ